MRKFALNVFGAAALTLAASAANAYVVIGITDTVSSATVFCSTQTLATVAACSGGFTAFGGGAVTVGATDIVFSGFIGGFRVTTTSLASNTPGTPLFGTLDQSSTSVERRAGFGTGTLFIDSWGYDYINPAGPLRTYSGSTSFSSSLYSNADRVSTILTVDPSNLGGGDLDAGTTSFGAELALPAYDGSSQSVLRNFAPVSFADTGSYSIRHQQAFRLDEGSLINSTATSIVRRIPEPVSASLVGLALVGLALASRKRA
jgi:hypothetical protein